MVTLPGLDWETTDPFMVEDRGRMIGTIVDIKYNDKNKIVYTVVWCDEFIHHYEKRILDRFILLRR